MYAPALHRIPFVGNGCPPFGILVLKLSLNLSSTTLRLSSMSCLPFALASAGLTSRKKKTFFMSKLQAKCFLYMESTALCNGARFLA